MPNQVLFISPHSSDAGAIQRMIDPLPLGCDHVQTVAAARASLDRYSYRVVLTEAALPDGTWIDVLQLARGAVDAAVIVTDRLADAHFWAEALNLGAYDVLAQPFYVSEVRRVLSNACTRVLSGWSRCAVL